MTKSSVPPVSIIIPAYNEAEIIDDVVSKLRNLYPEYELIIVDDGSTDGTAEKITVKDCRIIKHRVNKGYGASWKTGARQAKADIICFFDGDGQFDPGDVKKLLDSLKEYDSEMAVGVRGKDSYEPLLRKPGKFLLKKLAEFLTKEKIDDLNCGLRAFKKNVFMRYLHLFPDGFSASTTSTIVFLKRRNNVSNVPVKVRKRVGQSSAKQVKDGFGVMILTMRLIALFDPLRIFLPLAIFFLGFSIIYSIYETIDKGLGIPVFGAIVFSVGLLCFLLGILCDQIASLRLERYEYPEFADEKDTLL